MNLLLVLFYELKVNEYNYT